MKLLVLWLSGSCNLKCRYCYAAGGPSENMTLDTAKKAIELMGDEPFKVQFAGGEPLLNMDLLEAILAYLKEYRPQVTCSIQTNGTLINDRFAALAKKYRLAIGVSMDGRPEINEVLRGKTREVIRGIRLLGTHGIQVNLNTVVTSENVGHLADMVDMAIYLGNVRGIGLDLLRNAGRAEEGLVSRASKEPLKEGLTGLKKHLDTVNRMLPRKLVVREFEKAKYYLNAKNPCMDYCFASQGNSFVVLPDGECYPCGSLAGQERYYMGNVHSEIHPLRIRCTRPEQCTRCVYRQVCTGGCPSRGLFCGGFDELDCLMKKISFQFAEKKED